MPADEGEIVAERQHLGTDGVHQRLVAAERQVGAADRALNSTSPIEREPLRAC